MKTAVLFSGQGIQRRGMGRELFAMFPDHAARSARILGYDLVGLCLDDPDGCLGRTAFTQPAIYVVSCLAYLRFRRDQAPPDYVAGHSVGEYAAMFAAGVFDFETGLDLVATRGRLMGQADGGGLTAAINVSTDRIRAILEEPATRGCELANLNTPLQCVVGGTHDSLSRFEARCAAEGIRTARLNVSGAFHTSAMTSAAHRFGDHLRRVRFAPPSIPIVLNLTSRFWADDDTAEVLARHIASPVRWNDCIQTLRRAGATRFEELPNPGPLSGMLRAQSTPVVPVGKAHDPRGTNRMKSASDIEDFIATFVGRELAVDGADVDPDLNLGAFGLSSMTAMKLIGLLDDALDTKLPPVIIFENPTITRLATAIADRTGISRRV